MPEISNLKKPWKIVMALSICWTYLSGTLRADCIGVITSYMVVLYLVREYVEILKVYDKETFAQTITLWRIDVSIEGVTDVTR